ncbi:MAG: Quinone oxidoreductase 2 [Candidatus Accumulibacter appositus]|uniref:Quinone oxidoreductase 2 n=1 Tax=Candidatus Accumulibacter appositus TaxID=1454003 RepID=A0A011NHL4_9PROT|nr:NAD(P)H-binding protein [Accumulibacter sp.]EXI82273.1 MAG: Quinone oxidoreductase 2 [Candidatus Accumulibacter appositus]HRF05836.1 NAD(P)H-binding protein [Accumulibacter sp.]
MILVTGASGHLGRRIVDRLIVRGGGAAGMAASVRDPAGAGQLAERGVSVREGDFDQPDALASAFVGVDKLILVSTDGPKGLRSAQHQRAISAAKSVGVQHILYTSLIDVTVDSPADFAAAHRTTEADLAASGRKFTALRNPLDADLLPMTLASALKSGVFQLPAGAGRVSFVSRAELAEATAAAALAPALARNVNELSGEATHDYHEVAAAVAYASGRPIRYQPVSEDAYAAALAATGVSGWLARPLACLAQELFGTR